MKPFGHTRSRVTPSHALITPDTHVWSTPPGWTKASAAVHISPHIGARFSQSTITIEAGGGCEAAPPGIERVLFVLEGAVEVGADVRTNVLESGRFVYLPPDRPTKLTALAASRVALFEKAYEFTAGCEPPEQLVGNAADVAGEPFMGDPDARLQVLLPTDERFDLAVNLFTYQPGATLPQVEIHVMEHGLLMLDGAGVYRLGDDWYPVEAGDVIWMASYCPQWFVAMGKQPARYLYYKDVNRHPLGVFD
jgi:(S)-ureidoglycine aminohydrolase